MIQLAINLLTRCEAKGTTMACTYKLNSTDTVYSVSDFDDYLKSLSHETLAKYSPVVAALLGESSSGVRFSKSPSKTLKQLESENKSTLPKVPSGNVFLNPIDELDYAVRLKVDDAFESDSVERKQVDISDIIPTQKNITIHNLKSTSKYMDEPVNLVLKDNKYYVMDGHHRIANSILSGNSSINANVFDSKINNTKFSKSPQQTTSSTVAQVKSWLPKRVQGMLDNGKLRVVQSVNDLPAHLREAGAAMLHVAWQGGAADHNKHDSSYIGTGEGNAVFGHGHYFSDLEDIAKWYRDTIAGNMDMLSDRAKVYIDNVMLNKIFSGSTSHEEYQKISKKLGLSIRATELIYNAGGSLNGAIKQVTDHIEQYEKLGDRYIGSVNSLNEVKNELEGFDKNRIKTPVSGKVYQVELSPTQDQYLDWNKPLNEQSDFVKERLRSSSDKTGANLYHSLHKSLDSQQKASETLSKLGIRGIRYKADTINGTNTSGASNYVIFSDDDITITNKYSKLNGIQGLYDVETDKTYLVADMLTKDNTNIVLSHELFHRFYATDPKAKAVMSKMMFGARESFDQASRGKGTKTELSAYQRVINAKTPEKDQIEEYLAYEISSFLENPKNVTPTLANLIKNWIASIRMALLRYGMDMGFVRSLTPRDLVALSNYGARVDAIANPMGKGAFASTSDKDLETLLSTYANESGAPSRTELAEALRQYRTIESQYFNDDGTPKDSAMVAPNGEPTNLNRQQWITVRTENFKNWFGDWENNPKNASKVVDENGEPQVNYHGTDANFNEFDISVPIKNGRGEGVGFYFSPDKRLAKKYTKTKKIKSVFLNVRNDWRGFDSLSKDEKNIYLGTKSDKEAYEKLRIDAIQHGGTWIIFNPNQVKSTANTGVFGKSNDIRFSVAPRRLTDAWIDWWNNSMFAKTDKETGRREPIKFYHATNAPDLTFFDKEKLGSNTATHATSGLGFFFSPLKADVQQYGSNVVEVYLSANKVYSVNSYDLPMFDSLEEAKLFSKSLQKKGYDAIWIKDAKYAIVFESNQAKLTSNEEPTQSPDIRYSFAGENAQTADKLKEEIVNLYLSGLSSRVIGKQFGIDKSTVIEYVKKAGILPRTTSEHNGITEDMKAEAVMLYKSGMSSTDVASKVGVNLSSVLRWVVESGGKVRTALEYTGKTEETKEKVISMYEEGMSAAEIARIYGVDAVTVTSWAKAAGLKIRGISESKGITRSMVDDAIELYKGGMSLKSVGKQLGVSPNSVLNWLSAAGVKTRNTADLNTTNKDIKNKAISLYQEGMSTIETGKKIGVAGTSVTRWIKEAGLVPRGHSEAASLLYDSGKTKTGGVRSIVKTIKFGDIRADSTYEAARIIQLDKNPDVIYISRYKGSIVYGNGKRYHPDLYVKYADGTRVVEEIKPVFRENDNDVIEKANAARELLGDDVSYKIITQIDIDFNIGEDNIIFTNEDEKLRFKKALLSAKKAKDKNYPPANTDNGVRFSVASSAVDYLTNQPRNVTSASDLQSLIDSKKLPKQKRFNTDSIIENFVDSSHPLRVWSRILPDTLAANKMLDNFDRASGVKATIEKQAAIKFKRQISASIKDFAKEQGVNFDVAMEIIGNWASMRYALESGQKWIYTDTEMTALKSDIESKFGKANLEQAIQPVLDMNQWRLSELDDKEGKLSGTDLTDLQTPNYVPLLDNHAINDSYAELEDSAKFVGFKDFRNSLKAIHKGLFDDIKAANPTLSDDEINDKIKANYDINKTKKGVTITNPEAQLAMTDLSNEAVPSILKPIAAFTRFQSKMVTAFLVGFAPTNMIRDVAERTENLRTRTVAGYETVDMNSVANQAIKRSAGLLYNIKKVMMNVLAEGTILEDKFKADNTNPDVQDFREYLKLGASSTYGDLLADDKQGLAKELKKVGSIPDKAMDVLLLWNNAFEMISGFSAYQSMVAHGIDKKSAAATSLNLMNFRKRGKIMSPLRALFMFAQPIAIGGHQLAKTLSTRRGLMRLAAYTVASMIIYSLLRGLDGDDDELGYNRMDESSNFSLYRNIRIPLGDGEYFDLPVGFGMQQLAWSHGVNFVRTALGTMTTGEMLGESALLWVKSTAPVSPAEGSIMKNPAVYLAQTFTPQVARPVMNVALDVNAFMSPLTNSRYERTDKAKALQGRANTPQEYKDIAEVLGKAGIDMYPEQIRELMRGYGAGLFNEAIKYFIENPAKEDRGLKTVSPLIDRWIKVSNDDQIKQKLYYNARDKMNAASVAKSNGAELTHEESQLAELGDTLKKREASTRGKFAAATKAEKAGQAKRAELLRKVADMQRNKYMDFAFEKMKEITN